MVEPGSNAKHHGVDGGTLEVESSSGDVGTHLLSGATLIIGGPVSGFVVGSGVVPGGVGRHFLNTTMLHGGTLELVAGGSCRAPPRSAPAASSKSVPAPTLSGFTVSGGVTLDAAFGGAVSIRTVGATAKLFVESGGIATSATVKSGGLEVYLSVAHRRRRHGRRRRHFRVGRQQRGRDRLDFAPAPSSKSVQGFTLSGNTFSAGVTWKVLAGRVAAAAPSSPARPSMFFSGGEASGITVSSGGRLITASGGLGESVR